MEDDVIARVNKEDDVISIAKFFVQVILTKNAASYLIKRIHIERKSQKLIIL